MKNFLGYIAYEGPSEIDGAPIVVIVNRIDQDSENEKTGALVLISASVVMLLAYFDVLTK